jgi:hypothetical protein
MGAGLCGFSGTESVSLCSKPFEEHADLNADKVKRHQQVVIAIPPTRPKEFHHSDTVSGRNDGKRGARPYTAPSRNVASWEIIIGG